MHRHARLESPDRERLVAPTVLDELDELGTRGNTAIDGAVRNREGARVACRLSR